MNLNSTDVLIVGAGPAGLAAAIQLKLQDAKLDVCVIDKAAEPGNHNLSGAVLEKEPLEALLDASCPDWRESDDAKTVLAQKVESDNVLFFATKNIAIPTTFAITMAKMVHLPPGQMDHMGDYIVSISRLTKWLSKIACDQGVEVLTGFAAQDILCDSTGTATGVKLIDSGLDKEGNKEPNYLPGDIVSAKFILLAEGCDGLLTEKFIEKAGLERKHPQLYSVGVKELIKVSDEQYEKFTSTRVVHALGYPIWTPLVGPAIFGGGIMYPGIDGHISVGMITGADWKYRDFNPQDALTLFKEHAYVKQFIEGGTVVEAGAHMIPEAGFYGIPRDPATNSIGKANVLLLGDAAGFVNMQKIKGLHNAIDSGISAAKAVVAASTMPDKTAQIYTELINKSNVHKEMFSSRNYRQTIAKFGLLQGLPLSALGGLLPAFKPEPDYQAMKPTDYRLKPDINFDKDTFTAVAATEHREEQPSHLTIIDPTICREKCAPLYGRPCITFCPAGVYEAIGDELKAANPSNCLHCKTCQRKCPFDNIRWTVPEGTGGPRYKRM
jgi:electron-transferring-flavoprotein dehydrogenase